MSAPILYTGFHLNLAFSSIATEQHAVVIERCYWPLLKLADQGFPIGIEITSHTLRTVQAIDPTWVDHLRHLIAEGRVELIASGYVQMIAPLVPPEVTRMNLAFGLADYETLLGVKPRIALLNEQAYGPGLVPIYRDMGFEALMMDWAEPASHHRDWPASFGLAPQIVEGAGGATLPVIWSDAISFQKFQRYAHGELEPDEYIEFLTSQLGNGAMALPLYTSDAEVFDYRPGRYSTETSASPISEFERVSILLKAISRNPAVRLGTPSDVLAIVDRSARPLRFESAAVPVPVKKQRKYNLVRWAVTGRDDLSINTYCWREFEALKQLGDQATEDHWRNLCCLWASDYRTHITEPRWRGLLDSISVPLKPSAPAAGDAGDLPAGITVTESRRYLSIETPDMHLMLKLFRGLAIQSFGFGPAGEQQTGTPGANGLVGTLAHGFFRDILYGADFYSGHLIYEPANDHKVTDLSACSPTWCWRPAIRAIEITAEVALAGRNARKTVNFYVDEGRIDVTYGDLWACPVDGILRLAHVTLNPRAFEKESLYFSCHNGGERADHHPLWADGRLVEVDHGHQVSRLVTAQTAMGMTGGYLELGDRAHFVRLEMARTDAAGVGMIKSETVDDSFFVRAAISLREGDETSIRPALDAAQHLGTPIIRYGIRIGRHA